MSSVNIQLLQTQSGSEDHKIPASRVLFRNGGLEAGIDTGL